MAEAQFALGDALMAGSGVTKDQDAAVQWYRRAANQNHEGARHRLDAAGVTTVDG
jgi:TPR repeat protein